MFTVNIMEDTHLINEHLQKIIPFLSFFWGDVGQNLDSFHAEALSECEGDHLEQC